MNREELDAAVAPIWTAIHSEDTSVIIRNTSPFLNSRLGRRGHLYAGVWRVVILLFHGEAHEHIGYGKQMCQTHGKPHHDFYEQ